jgi:hypothetical protein
VAKISKNVQIKKQMSFLRYKRSIRRREKKQQTTKKSKNDVQKITIDKNEKQILLTKVVNKKNNCGQS